jgi:hypothetical protein
MEVDSPAFSPILLAVMSSSGGLLATHLLLPVLLK